jgi:hypothetical protein
VGFGGGAGGATLLLVLGVAPTSLGATFFVFHNSYSVKLVKLHPSKMQHPRQKTPDRTPPILPPLPQKKHSGEG